MIRCHACRKKLEIAVPVGRRDECPFCRADLRCCLNCICYEAGAYNECREPQADRVMEKDKSNFCDFFVFRNVLPAGNEGNERNSARAKLESLFRKG